MLFLLWRLFLLFLTLNVLTCTFYFAFLLWQFKSALFTQKLLLFVFYSETVTLCFYFACFILQFKFELIYSSHFIMNFLLCSSYSSLLTLHFYSAFFTLHLWLWFFTLTLNSAFFDPHFLPWPFSHCVLWTFPLPYLFYSFLLCTFNSELSSLCVVLCTVYSAHFTLHFYSALFILYSLLCMFYSAFCTMQFYPAHFTLSFLLCTFNSGTNSGKSE